LFLIEREEWNEQLQKAMDDLSGFLVVPYQSDN